MADFLTASLPFLFILIALLALGQVTMAFFLKNSEEEFLEKLTHAYGLPEQEKKNWSVLHRAIRKAQELTGAAELEGVKTVARAKYYTRELETAYEREFRQGAMRAIKDFESELAALKQEYGKLAAELRAESREAQETKIKEMNSLVDDALLGFTKGLGELSELESKRAGEEIEEYKKTRLAQVDQSAAAVLEETTKIVLGKKLPLAEQENLIGEALEQAKAEKFVS